MQQEPVSFPFAPAADRARGSESRWHVVCLCAEWCGVCRQYRAAFEGLASRIPDASLVWLDVEDEADVAGDVDVETFPTLVVADGEGRVRFAGPVIPQPEVLVRMVASLRSAPAEAERGPADAAGPFDAMVRRLRSRAEADRVDPLRAGS